MTKTKGQILIIDDDPGICTTLCDILKDEGYEVKDFEEGRKALDFLKKNPFEVVFNQLDCVSVGVTLGVVGSLC